MYQQNGKKYYTRGTRFRLLGVLFALSGLLCWAGISQVIANSVSQSFANAFNFPPLYTTIVWLLFWIVYLKRRNSRCNLIK